MNKKSQTRLIVFIVLVVLATGIALANYAFPGATGANTVMVAQACNNGSNSASSNGFTQSCNTSRLDLNDGLTQNSTVSNNNRYAGMNMTSYNSSVTNCGAISDVKLCYEWWFTGGTSTLSNCLIEVDADGGANYSVASPSCPGTTANPGLTCIDVTSIENWQCSDFFTASGTRAAASAEALFASSPRVLVVDALYFNVTYSADDIAPAISIVYPTNTTYTSNVTILNVTVTDTNLAVCKYSLDGGANTTFSCSSGVQANITGLTDGSGSHTWRVYANDSFSNNGSASVTFGVNFPPVISNASAQSPIAASTLLTIYANTSRNGVNDTEGGTLNFYCDNSVVPDAGNTECTGGTTSSTFPYNLTCTFTSPSGAGNYTKYCRVYDGVSYSSAVSVNYTVNSNAPSTSIVSVAGDTTPSYVDSVNDSVTNITISGESGMLCRWSSSDLAYSSMSNDCPVVGTQATCSVSDVSSQGFWTRYISCKSSLGNEQTASNNLDVSFYLDYTSPTTSDNSVSSVQLPGYGVTITEADNVDSDPKTYYCVSSSQGCSPTTSIDNGGVIVFNTRGANYLRYFSSDFAGNNQTIVNKTVNINRLPVFTSASDNAATILGGTTVTITTYSNDSDGQTMNLYVCSSSGASASGCSGSQYCTATATSNLTCGFASESDSATHVWYAYLFDSLSEAASANPLTGSYVTDSSGPVITVISPINTTYTQNSVTASISTSEAAASARYSLDGAANVTMSNVSSTSWALGISNLVIGLHNITFYANDTFGNLGTSGVVYFTIASPPDIVPPTITIVNPTNLSYTSLSPVLNISSDEALSWAGYKLNGSALTNLTNISTTSWNATLTLAQESTNTLIIYANDTSNNQANKTIIFYADTKAPRYSSVSASPNPTNQSVQVNCSIRWDDGFNISSVLISENSTGSYENHTIAFSGSSGQASYIIVGSKLANAGTYSCIFYATDAAGNSNSTSQTFTVNDVTAPTVTITSPTSGGVYNQNTIGVSVVTSENASAATYVLNSTGTNVTMGNTSSTSWNATLSSLANGAYTIKFYANDSSGNVGVSSTITFTVNAVSDTIPPVITVINPLNLSYNSLSVVLNISSNEALTSARYSLNGSANVTMSNTSLTSWNATLTLAQESTNTLVVYGNDTSGNIGATTITFYGDTKAPRYSAINLSPSSANQSQNVNCSIVWADAFNLSSAIISENSLGSYENHTIAFSGSSGQASYIIVGSKLANAGTYSCIFYATDAAGNSNSTSQTFIISDVTAPTLTVTSPNNGDTYNQLTVPLSVITSENASSVWYSLNGSANVTLGNTSRTNWNYTLTGLTSVNVYSIVFWANDSSGNLGTSGSKVFTINTGLADTIPPVLTINTIPNASYTALTGVALNITANENISTARYSLNGTANVTMTNISLVNWGATLSTLAQESTNTLIVYANDTAGNTGATTITFYGDTKAPRFISPTSANANETQNVNCTAYVNDSFALSSVKVGENVTGIFVNHTMDVFSAGWANYTILNVAKGNYSCIFYATDAAGNSNSTQTNFTVNDVTAPTLTVTSPSNATYGDSSISASLVTSENASSARYSLDGAANVSLVGSGTSWNANLVLTATGLHNITFYANDSSGNLGVSSVVYFTIALLDTIPPVLTINTIPNASYTALTGVALNITANENISTARYSLNGTANVTMTNISLVNWGAILSTLAQESTNTLIVYANDTSGNTGATTITFYGDTKAPRFISPTSANANETQNVNCTAYVNDSFALRSAIVSENATTSGVFMNHTTDLSAAGWANYTILNVAKGNYSCIFYATDAAGNSNLTQTNFTVNDVTAPTITINSPLNQNYSANSVLLSITSSENLTIANYSLDGGVTNTSLTGSGVSWSDTISLLDGSKSIIFYGVDGSGNLGSASVNFIVDTSVTDVTPPTITIWSPVANSYSASASNLFNITANENLSWAGYILNSGVLTDLGNASKRSWNKTLTLTEGQYNVTFYANDSSSNRNQGSAAETFYVDLAIPYVNLTCDNPVNDSLDVTCAANSTDGIGLASIIFSNNATGVWQNSTSVTISGNSDISYNTISASETTMPGFSVIAYTYDLSGRGNSSRFDVSVLDDQAPSVSNVGYIPNTTDGLDPGVRVNVSANASDNYNLASVKLMWMNESSWNYVDMTNTTPTSWNASFLPANGTYYIRVNATDAQGNSNISANYTLVVANDTSFYNSTTIPEIKSITYAQRTETNNLGDLYLNNTGDVDLNFSISISSSLLSRFDINGTGNTSVVYNASSGADMTLALYMNTTDLTTGLYDYSITISSDAGTSVYQKKIYIQTSAGPYLVTSISQYSSSVTRGQTDIELIAEVSNFGSQDASNVYLTWSLPSVFNLTQGELVRPLGNLPIGVSATNTIKVSVATDAADARVNITADANSTDSSSLDTKSITILNPLVITNVVSGPGAGGTVGGGAAGGGGAAALIYVKEIEITRGDRTEFKVDVHNPYPGFSLQDLTISLTGFLQQYMKISPDRISSIGPGENKSFNVLLLAPAYKDYEEHDLKAVISGKLNFGNSTRDYSETQYIKLIIQEISHQAALDKLDEARAAIEEMKRANFSTTQLESDLQRAEELINKSNRHKESFDISATIVSTKNTAFDAEDLLRRIIAAMHDPRKSNLIVNNPIRNLGGYDTTSSLESLLGGGMIFASASVQDLVDLSIAALQRGDYQSALDRVKQARDSLILERKGNFLLFIYLYWYYLILAFVLVSAVGFFGYRSYLRTSIGRRIKDLGTKEENVRKIALTNQNKYFAGKESAHEYHRAMAQSQTELAKIKKERVILGNTRVKILKPEQVSQDLERERKQVEGDIKNIQNKFYREKKISEQEYKAEFGAMGERIAEIEDEKTTLHLIEKKEAKKGWFGRIFNFRNNRRLKEEAANREKINRMLHRK